MRTRSLLNFRNRLTHSGSARISAIVVIVLCSGLVFEEAAANDETVEACEQAAKLLKDQDIDGALEEAGWCLEGIQQLKEQQTLAAFPDEVDGFAGGDTQSQNVMGIKMIERTYTRDNESIHVSLMGGGPATTGLAALATLGLNIGDGGKKMRIQKRTVVESINGDAVQLVVKMKSGGMLTLKSSDTSRDSLVSFTKSFPIKELDESLDAD